MGPYDRRPWEGSALTASLLLIELQFCTENKRHERPQSKAITSKIIHRPSHEQACFMFTVTVFLRPMLGLAHIQTWGLVLRLPYIRVRWAHGCAGLVVVRLTQLHSAVQIEVVRLCCEAKHVEAVANGGTSPVTARLSRTRVKKWNCLVVHTAG